MPQNIDRKLNQNKNFLGDDGIIYNIYYGDQTTATLKKVAKILVQLTNKQKKEKKPILVLTDVHNLSNVNLGARLYGVEMMQMIDYDKVAIIGANYIIKSIIMPVINAAGRGFKIKLFNSKKEAIEWLLGN